jgi:hypothetical protein
MKVGSGMRIGLLVDHDHALEAFPSVLGFPSCFACHFCHAVGLKTVTKRSTEKGL